MDQLQRHGRVDDVLQPFVSAAASAIDEQDYAGPDPLAAARYEVAGDLADHRLAAVEQAEQAGLNRLQFALHGVGRSFGQTGGRKGCGFDAVHVVVTGSC